nr:hypothetical protein [Tanacetum cinerariifolium]
MALKRTTRSTPVITIPTPKTTTSVTNAQLQAMINHGFTAALATRDANRNGDDSHTSGTGRHVQVARECTYPDFLKCQPLNFKGTEGVVGLSQWQKLYKVPLSSPMNLRTRRSTLGLNVRLITKENLMTPPGTTISNQTRDKTLEELMLHGMVKGRSMLELYHCATSARNPTYYECGNQGYYISDCPELKNQDHGNQAGGTGPHGMVHALEGGETNQDLNDVEDDINA